MSDLTIETVQAAKDGDSKALADVLAACESRVQAVAYEGAKRMGYGLADHQEEFSLTAREALWEGLTRRFEFQEVPHIDQFNVFAYRTMQGAVTDEVYSLKSPGADKWALQAFKQWVDICEGDVYAAEKRCTEVPPAGSKLERFSAARAYATRLAWQGSVSLDMPVGAEGSSGTQMTLADTIAAIAEVPTDLVEPSDINAFEREQTRQRVTEILGALGEKQSNVLRHTYGIGGCPVYATGRNGNDDGALAAVVGVRDATAVQITRVKGFLSFAKRWVPMVALNDEEMGAWWAAYQSERDRNKRLAVAA